MANLVGGAEETHQYRTQRGCGDPLFDSESERFKLLLEFKLV